MGGSVTDRSSFTLKKKVLWRMMQQAAKRTCTAIKQYIDYEKRGVFMKDVSISSLENMKLKELYELARHYKISYYSKLTKKN